MSRNSGKKRAKKQKQRQKVRRGDNLLKDWNPDGELFNSDDVIILTNPEMKMSEVLIEFAQPLLKVAKTTEQFRTAISLAGLAWNAALLGDKDIEKEIRDLIPKSNPVYDDILPIMEMLKDRKHRDFYDYDRVIIDYQISGKAPDYHLSVISSPIKDNNDLDTIFE